MRQPTDTISKEEGTIRQGYIPQMLFNPPSGRVSSYFSYLPPFRPMPRTRAYSSLHRPSKSGLTEYLASLRRINEALSSLKKSNLRSSQKAVTQMVRRGVGVMDDGTALIEFLPDWPSESGEPTTRRPI